MKRSETRDSIVFRHTAPHYASLHAGYDQKIRDTHNRHHRACPGDPRLRFNDAARQTWMAGSRPAMTSGEIAPPHFQPMTITVWRWPHGRSASSTSQMSQHRLALMPDQHDILRRPDARLSRYDRVQARDIPGRVTK
jgi:hypothetical protein